MAGRLDGKVAIITGSAHGQGAAAARLFAREGARVTVTDVDAAGSEAVAEDIKNGGGLAISVPCDVSREEQVRDLVRATVDEFGSLNVLYNNAGTEAGDGRVTDLTVEAWDRIQNVNLKGIFFTCKYGIPELVSAGGGSIINTSSVGGLIGGEGLDSYTATKGAIISLTRSLAITYAGDGIRANTICPGLVLTPMVERIGEEFIAAASAAAPLGRGAKPEEIAYLSLFLASDEASFMTGATIPIDGGLTAQ